MRHIRNAVLALAAVIGLQSAPAQTAGADAMAQDTEQQQLSRAMGTVLGTALQRSISQIEQLGVEVDRPLLIQTVLSVIDGQPTGFGLEEADRFVSDYVYRMQQKANQPADSAAQTEFLAQAAAQPNTTVTPTGLVFTTLTPGSGPTLTDTDSARLIYTGRLADGTVFDRSEEPVVFTVTNLVPGFSEALKMMQAGGKYVITFPASIGYGARGIPGAIPGGAALQFDVELLEIVN